MADMRMLRHRSYMHCTRMRIAVTEIMTGSQCDMTGQQMKQHRGIKKRSRPFKLVAHQPTEFQEQANLFQWAEFAAARWPELRLLFAIPNGAHLVGGGRQAIQLKKTGLKPGVPDMCLPAPRGGYAGLWIELKRAKTGRTSREQQWWIRALLAQGYRAEVCHGWEAAREVLQDYLSPNHENAGRGPATGVTAGETALTQNGRATWNN